MKTTFTGTMQPLDTTIPDPALIVMIGASGSGKMALFTSSAVGCSRVWEAPRFTVG